jgi:hypothetical protein
MLLKVIVTSLQTEMDKRNNYLTSILQKSKTTITQNHSANNAKGKEIK